MYPENKESYARTSVLGKTHSAHEGTWPERGALTADHSAQKGGEVKTAYHPVSCQLVSWQRQACPLRAVSR